jgi:sugar lactone lactonase YvrE
MNGKVLPWIAVVFAVCMIHGVVLVHAGQPALYATFRGEESTGAINNVVAFDSTGAIVIKDVLADNPSTVSLSELRSLSLDKSGVLWVANSHKSDSAILRYDVPGPDGTRKFINTWASFTSQDPGLMHPYKVLVLDEFDEAFVSVQDTAEVLRFNLAGLLQPVSSYLTKNFPDGKFDPGAFVGSSSVVPTDLGGLVSPRSLAVSSNNSLLFVADNEGQAVRVYDRESGQYIEDLYSDPVGVPVGIHLTADGGSLLVSLEGLNEVVSIDLNTRKVETLLSGFDSPAGLGIGCDGALYVANRKARMIVRSVMGSHVFAPFSPLLDDEPEQILLLPCA